MIAWGVLQILVDQCVNKGLIIEQSGSPDGNIHFSDWREAVFGGRAACYVPFERRMYLNWLGLQDYWPYQGQVHELGHAVWFLLLQPVERWNIYYRAWAKDKAEGRGLGDYWAASVEEGWAEDFEAFWRREMRPRLYQTERLPALVRFMRLRAVPTDEFYA